MTALIPLFDLISKGIIVIETSRQIASSPRNNRTP